MTVKVDNRVDGMVGAVAIVRVLLGFGVGAGVDGVNFCQPGVNLCQVLVTVGKVEVAGGAGGSAAWWGERHGVALLFWCKRSRSWGKWGVCSGSCLRRNDGRGAGVNWSGEVGTVEFGREREA